MTRILCLDDDPEMGRLMVLILEESGYEALSSLNSYEAWALLHSLPVDLFTQDILRPGLDGTQFFRLLRQDPALDDIPIVIVSAGAGYSEVANLPADAQVRKPFIVRDLLTILAGVLARRGRPGPTAADLAWGQAQMAWRKAQPEFSHMLNNPTAGRFWSVRGADRYEVTLTLEALVDQLAAGEVETRLKAAHDLGLIGDLRAVEPLGQALADDTWPVRWAAAQSLGWLKAVEVIPSLVAALAAEQPIVRLMAGLALADIGDPAAVQPLTTALAGETDPVARRAMAEALGRLEKAAAGSRPGQAD